MRIFDSHCHLDDKGYDRDRDQVVQRAVDCGVICFMTVGTRKETSEKAVELAETIEGCYAAVGVHPHNAKDCTAETIGFLKELAENPGVKAWGEIGLDFNRMFSPQAAQEKSFIRQLDAAAELNLPVILHERDSGGRFTEMLKSRSRRELKGVVHCFSGTGDELETYLGMGLYVGITGVLTIKGRGAALRELVRDIPLDRILLETDAPYLTPAPWKNKTRRNEPAFLTSVLTRLAGILEMDENELAEKIWENTLAVFGIEP